MRLDMEWNRSTLALSAAWLLIIVLGLATDSMLRAQPVEKSRVSIEDLSIEQEDLKEIIVDLVGKMEKLARELEETEPDDAKLIRSAKEKIETAALSQTLDQIRQHLSDQSLFQALAQQEKAIDILDLIIKLLEEKQFETENFSEQAKALRAKRELVKKLGMQQEKLLNKTKAAREQRSMAEALSKLKDALDGLSRQQKDLESGKDPDTIDPEASTRDAKSLEQALDRVKRLEKDQTRVNDAIGKLPERGSNLEETRRLARRLQNLISRAENLDQKSSALEQQESQLGNSSKKNDSPSGDSGDTPKEGGKPESGDEAEDPDGSNSPAEKTPGSETKKDTTSGPSALEMARRRQAFEESRKSAADSARDLAKDLKALAGDWKKSPPRDETGKTVADKPMNEASEKAGKASKNLSQGKIAEARQSISEMMKKLREAQSSLGEAQAKSEKQNTMDTAGAQQEQNRIAKEASEASSQMSQQSRKATASEGQQALQKGSEAMQKAAGAMQRARQAMASGQKSEAQKAGQRAQQALAEASKQLERGRKAVGSQSPQQKKAALQRKLARKTEQKAAEAERLQRKLGRKKPEQGRDAAAARDELQKASSAMREAARAQEQGQADVARRKQKEALKRLERAKDAVEKEEKEQLRRLERQSLKKESDEQKRLARDTRNAAKNSDSKAGDSRSREQSEQLDRAGETMEKAAEKLDQEQLADAEQKQEEALNELRSQQRDLQEEEERLEELRREQENIVMLKELGLAKKKQLEINEKTLEVDSTRKGRESRRMKARIKSRLKPGIEAQGQLSDRFIELQNMLEAERSRVFAFMLQSISSDMKEARGLLTELETGEFTQFLQNELVEDIDRLIAALEEQQELMKRQREQKKQQQGQPQAQGRESLISITEDLLMLKQMQKRVNRQTRSLEDMKNAQEKPSEIWDQALERLSQKQSSVSKLTLQILEDFRKAQQVQILNEDGSEGSDEESPSEDSGETGEAPDTDADDT